MTPQEYKPELYPERISEELQKTLFILACGAFSGFVFGLVVGVIIS